MHELLLRVLALLFTLIAAILLAVDKQTSIVPLQISADLPPFNVPVTAKSTYISAFVYFVVVNCIACVFSAITLGLALVGKGGTRLMVIVIDLIMVALLFSSLGAAGAVGLIGITGNSHLKWNKVCNVYAKFCNQVKASVGLSFFAGIAFVLLLLLAANRAAQSDQSDPIRSESSDIRKFRIGQIMIRIRSEINRISDPKDPKFSDRISDRSVDPKLLFFKSFSIFFIISYKIFKVLNVSFYFILTFKRVSDPTNNRICLASTRCLKFL